MSVFSPSLSFFTSLSSQTGWRPSPLARCFSSFPESSTLCTAPSGPSPIALVVSSTPTATTRVSCTSWFFLLFRCPLTFGKHLMPSSTLYSCPETNRFSDTLRLIPPLELSLDPKARLYGELFFLPAVVAWIYGVYCASSLISA